MPSLSAARATAWIFLGAFAWPAHAAAPTPSPLDLELRTWELCAGELPPDRVAEADAPDCRDVPFTFWGRLELEPRHGTRWMRTEIGLDGIDRPTLLLGKIASAYELWVDGERLGTAGRLPPDPAADYDRHLLAAIPARLAADDRVVVALRIWAGEDMGDFGGGPFEGRFLLGEGDDLARRSVLDDLVPTVLVVLFAFAGLYHLVLSLRGSGDRSFRWFGILALDFALYTFLRTQWKYATGLSFPVLKELEFLAMYLAPAIGLEFFWSLVGRRIGRWLRIYQVGLLVLATAVVLEPGMRWNLLSLDFFYLALVPFCGATLFELFREARRGSAEARDLLVASAILFATVFADILMAKGYSAWPRLTPFGFGVLLLGMAVALATKMGRLQLETESLRADLERRVSERTLELETLQEIVQAINRRFELEDVMRAVLDQGRRLLPQADRGVFFTRDRERDVFEVVAATGWEGGSLELVLPADVALRRYRDEAEELAPGITLIERPEAGAGIEHVAHLSNPRSLLCFRIDVDGEVAGFVVFDDLTERDAFRRLEIKTLSHYREQAVSAVAKALSLRELSQKRQEAEQASRAKSDFLATISHELRSPLNSIIGFSSVLLDGSPTPDDPRHGRFLENIQSSGRHLLSLINEILDLSKIEAGRMDARIEVLDVAESVAGVVGISFGGRRRAVDRAPDRRRARSATGRRRRRDVPSDPVEPDLQRDQVLARRRPDRSPGPARGRGRRDGTVVLEVEDRGIGIHADDQERIFRPFEQADSSLARRFSGTGLGLALVRQMLDLQDGTVEVDSKPGEGSVFRVRLPMYYGDGTGDSGRPASGD